MQFAVHLATGEIYNEKNAPTTKLLEPSPSLRFTINYPLTNPKTISLTHDDGTGWTEQQFVEAVITEYETVYAEEGENPGHIPGMLNRAPSKGIHGIWGHDLGDLVLEGATKGADGSWILAVGS